MAEYGGSEVTHHSWLSRAKNSIAGALFGVLLFFGSFALLGWNEARSVAEIRALNECASKLISVVREPSSFWSLTWFFFSSAQLCRCQPLTRAASQDCSASSQSNGALVHVACPIPGEI